MLKNQDFVESHKFEGRLKEFEQILIDFIMDSGRAKSVEPTLQRVLGYIAIHRKLTQKQLIDLTQLSSGTISKKLREILRLGMIKKEKIPKTNKSIYRIAPEAIESAADTAWEEFAEISEFLKGKQEELVKYKEKKGSKLLSGRITGLLKTFEAMENIWSDIKENFIHQQKK